MTINRPFTTTFFQAALFFAAAIVPSLARAANLPADSLVGEWNSFGVGGAIGYVAGLSQPGGSSGIGQFGFDFHGKSRVDSITFTQLSDPNRYRPQDVTVYTSPTQSYNFTLSNTQASQTITLPSPVETSYFYIGVKSKFVVGADQNWGVQAVSVAGAQRLHFDVNQVAGVAGASVTASGLLNAGAFPISRVVDGALYAAGTGTAAYFTRDAGQDSFTVSFATPRSVSSIGLGLELGGGGRDIPKWVNVIDSSNNSQQVNLGADPTQYGRYQLTTPIANTSSLKIEFPNGSNASDWYIHGDFNHGVTELQAFSSSIYAQITDPVVTNGANAYDGGAGVPYNTGGYPSGNAFNNDANASSYASNSLGAGTFLDFDFGQARRMSAFEFQPRLINNFDEVWTSNLIFSNDPTFTTNIATVTIDHQRNMAGPAIYPFADQTARYVRWDVTNVPNAGGNTGASEIGFYATTPSYHTLAPTPTVIASATAFNGSYTVSRLFDNDVDTDYATAGLGTGTFVELDFGSPQVLAGVEFLDRLGPVDWIGSFRLTFSMDNVFGNAGDTTLDVLSRSAAYESFPGRSAQYVRFEVLTAAGASLNFGGRELLFYIPEPSSLVLLGFGVVALGAFRKRRSVAR